jgi:hypothetical protein
VKWEKYADAMRRYYDERGEYPAFGETARRLAKLGETPPEEEVSKEPGEALPPRNPIQQARRTRRKHWK